MAYLDTPSSFKQNQEYLLYGDTRPAPGMDQSERQQSAARVPQEWGSGKATGAGGGC